MSIYVNKHPIETFNFSGGECHVKIAPTQVSAHTHIVAYLYQSNDIMRLLLTVDAVRRINPRAEIELVLPYFPYSRQDRVCNSGEALSVHVMAQLINALDCAKVVIIDPHSDVTTVLLKNVSVISMADIIAHSVMLHHMINTQPLVLLSPDAGAEKKVHQVAQRLYHMGIETNVMCATKHRDVTTGKITRTQIYGDVRDKHMLMLDDICDGGRTFIELAKVLQAQHAAQLYLYTTHGIFSQGLAPFRPYFAHVYCCHTMLPPEHRDPSFLTVLPSLTF